MRVSFSQVSEIPQKSTFLLFKSAYKAAQASGLATDLAFNTMKTGICFATLGPDRFLSIYGFQNTRYSTFVFLTIFKSICNAYWDKLDSY